MTHNWFRSPGQRRETYWLRLTPEEKAELFKLAEHAGVTVADALRQGGRDWLLARQPIGGAVEQVCPLCGSLYFLSPRAQDELGRVRV